MTELQRKTREGAPLRLYCDICEVFDLHDTTDCPTQAMDVEYKAIRVKNKKVKPKVRSYCEQCEGKNIFSFLFLFRSKFSWIDTANTNIVYFK